MDNLDNVQLARCIRSNMEVHQQRLNGMSARQLRSKNGRETVLVIAEMNRIISNLENS